MKKGIVPFNFVPGLLSEPGDEFSMKVTKSRRKVAKLKTRCIKMSQTMYPTTGTIVQTRVLREEP